MAGDQQALAGEYGQLQRVEFKALGVRSQRLQLQIQVIREGVEPGG